jgi:hypothetical protein
LKNGRRLKETEHMKIGVKKRRVLSYLVLAFLGMIFNKKADTSKDSERKSEQEIVSQ